MTRDEQTDHHGTFLALADYLNCRGIAVLRYDKRGVGSSGGNFDAARISDFVSDAEAALKYLLARRDVNIEHIGIIGHSEGGAVAADARGDEAHRRLDR
jgi:alpha/beta superfamily hydrolase